MSVEIHAKIAPIAIIAPMGRDAAVIHQTLSSNGIDCRIVSPQELVAGIQDGSLTGAILSEEALNAFDRSGLEHAIQEQPPWSDFPIVVLTLRGAPRGAGYQAIDQLGHVTLLERPLHPSALFRAARAILRTRMRQLQIEEFLKQQQEAHANAQALSNMRELFEKAPGFIAVTLGPEHHFEMANEAYRGLVAREVIGSTVRDALPELVDQGILELLDQVYATGEPFISQELPMHLRNAAGSLEPRWLSLVYQPLIGQHGEVKGLFCEGFDVTHQKSAQERVQLLQNELIHMSRVSAMGAMASTLSHELTQPLLAITSYLGGGAKLLEERGPAAFEKVGFAIRQAEKSALRAGNIIRSARAMVTGSKRHHDQQELSLLIQQALDLATIGAIEAGLICHTAFEPGLHVLVDRVQIQQVILNIVRNAIEAMGDQARRELTVSTKAHEGLAEVMVRDTGHGLTPEMRVKLFMPFVTSKAEGMGLGLSISRTIVEDHGGTIGAGEYAGGGTIVWFKLPLASNPLAA